MDIVTIYAQPDVNAPLRAFEGLMKSFKKYGFRECDKLRLVIPRGSREKMAQMQEMLDLLGSGHELIPVMYPSLRNDRDDLATYHNNIMCRAASSLRGVGSFLYIPFGCEPIKKEWGKTVESVMKMHNDKRFIGETRKNPEGFDYLSGVCVLDYEFIAKSSVWQAMRAKNYPLDRAARTMKGVLLSYPLPFSDLDVGGEKEEWHPAVAHSLTKGDKAAEKHVADVADSVSDKTEEKVAEFVAPEPVIEPVVVIDPIEEVKEAVANTEEAEVGDSPVATDETYEEILKKDFEDLHHATFKKNYGEELYEKLKSEQKKASKKKSKKRAKKKTAKKAAKRPFGINATPSDKKREDHSV